MNSSDFNDVTLQCDIIIGCVVSISMVTQCACMSYNFINNMCTCVNVCVCVCVPRACVCDRI